MDKTKTKFCVKCGKDQDISCFYNDKSKKDGLTSMCKLCIKQYQKSYSEQRVLYNKQYHENHLEQSIIYNKQYNKDNYKLIAKRKKQCGEDNALFENCYKQLKQFEEIRNCFINKELLEVRCSYCGRWMVPTNLQVKNRIQAFNGTTRGENRFYCSENCKRACPIYGQRKYPKSFKKATSREVVPLLRQLVLERDNYTCQKCGATTETAQLHVHHIVPYAQNKVQANDPDSCITLCKECHKWVHSQAGCRYIDLKCQ